MTNTIHWTYDYMYSWYCKHTDNPVANLDCIIYHAQRPKKKRNELEKFIKPNITYVGRCPVQDDVYYPNGLYTVIDDNKSQRKWLFYVYPINKDGIVFADHHSFCIDKSDKKRPVHFHTTEYSIKRERVSNEISYRDDKINDYFVDEMDMPRTGPFEGFLDGNPQKDTVLKLLREPWRRRSGGAKQKNTGKEYVPNRPIISPAFNVLWETYAFKSMFAFGVSSSTHTRWSVSFHRKGRRPPGRLQYAYTFELPRGHDEATFQNTLAAIASQNEHRMI